MITRLITLSVLLLMAGCGRKNNPVVPPSVPNSEKEEPKPVKLPGDEEAQGGTEVLITTAAGGGSRRDEYVMDEKATRGALRGLCHFAGISGRIMVPDRKPVNLNAPENAIKDPTEGEKNYYENIKMKEPEYFDSKGMVMGAFIIMRGIKVGRLPPLNRPGFMAKNGTLNALGGHGENLCVGPLNERVTLGTFDKYPCDLVLTNIASKKVIFEGSVAYKDVSVTHNHTMPQLLPSGVIRELGYYTCTCKRHPWQSSCLVVTDNPYVAMCNKDGQFEVPNVPIGTIKAEIWHPVYEPINKTVEFTIKDGETTEIDVLFKPPENLKTENRSGAPSPKPPSPVPARP